MFLRCRGRTQGRAHAIPYGLRPKNATRFNGICVTTTIHRPGVPSSLGVLCPTPTGQFLPCRGTAAFLLHGISPFFSSDSRDLAISPVPRAQKETARHGNGVVLSLTFIGPLSLRCRERGQRSILLLRSVGVLLSSSICDLESNFLSSRSIEEGQMGALRPLNP